MAKKSKKAEARAAAGRVLDSRTFHRFIGDVAALKQELDDAGTAHASGWKKADPLGIHPEAAKLYCRLDKMEDTKRADFLRAFDRYREWSDWAIQPDMFDDESVMAGAMAREADGDGTDEAPERSERAPAEPGPLPVTEEALKVDADLGEETAVEATEELAGAGFIFADGKQAALDGREAEVNPHAEGATAHSIWARGHARGVADKAEAESGETEADVVPLSQRRRSRRAEQEAPAIH
jgi:hypothetical protein